MRAVWVLIAILLAPSIARAEALIVISRHSIQSMSWCRADKIYTSQSKDAPTRIAKSFQGKGALVAFRTCTDEDGNTHYFVREPRPNRNGVCRTYENELFPGNDQDEAFVTLLYDGTAPNWYIMMKGWKSWPPPDWLALHYTPQNSVLGFVSNSECPRGDDPRYIKLKHVTDGTLKAFENFWKRITSDEEEFARAFAAIPADQKTLVVGLRAAASDQHGQFWSIDCEENGCAAFAGLFELDFDMSDRGLEIKGIKKWEQID